MPMEVTGHFADAVGNGAAATLTLGLFLHWGCGQKPQPVGQLACSLPPEGHNTHLSSQGWQNCSQLCSQLL